MGTGGTVGTGAAGPGRLSAAGWSKAPPLSTAAYQGCSPTALIKKSTLFQMTCASTPQARSVPDTSDLVS